MPGDRGQRDGVDVMMLKRLFSVDCEYAQEAVGVREAQEETAVRIASKYKVVYN